MMGFFSIFALPRSRTAWLSNWLTTDNSICLHEFSNGAKDGLWDFIQSIESDFVGISEPGIEALDYIPSDVLMTFPMVIIKQDPAFSFKKCLSAWPSIYSGDNIRNVLKNILNQWSDVLDKLSQCENCKTFYEHDLNDLNVLSEIWEHLLPDIKHNKLRTKLLMEIDMSVKYRTIDQGYQMIKRQKETISAIRSMPWEWA
jgi:hypothetical protein